MLAVGSAWKGLAAELRATALSYASALSGPSSEEWQGAASAAMVDAATPYVTWMSTTAVQALSSIFDGWNIFAPGSGSSSSGLSGLLNFVSGSNNSAYGQLLNADIWNTIFSSGFYMSGNYLGTAADYMGLGRRASRPTGPRRYRRRPTRPRAVRPTGRHRKFCQLHRCGLGPSGAGRPVVGAAELDRPRTVAQPAVLDVGGTPMVPRRRWQQACPQCRWAT